MRREALLSEARHVELDLAAFRKAQEVIRGRIQDMEVDDPPRCEEFTKWACTQVIMNAFILATTRCEGMLEDYQKLLDQLPAPNLQLVKENDYE